MTHSLDVRTAPKRAADLEEDFTRLREGARSTWKSWRILYPLLAVAAGVILWYALIYFLDMPNYILPPPERILVEIFQQYHLMLRHGWVTMYEAVAGFLLGVAIGVPCALLIVWSEPLGRALMPLLIFSQTMPKVAIAPLFLLWFGFGILPKIIVAFLICFFPIVISMATGLQSVEREMVELVRSMSATNFQVFLKARVPTSLPYLFSGLKVSITLSVIGAIVGEFVGSNEGLGYLVLVANGNVDTALLFAILIVLACIGFILYGIIPFLERLFIPWHAGVKAHERQPEYTY
ncbi:MAG: ABC transporter permease [Nitrospinota bacterium]